MVEARRTQAGRQARVSLPKRTRRSTASRRASELDSCERRHPGGVVEASARTTVTASAALLVAVRRSAEPCVTPAEAGRVRAPGDASAVGMSERRADWSPQLDVLESDGRRRRIDRRRRSAFGRTLTWSDRRRRRRADRGRDERQPPRRRLRPARRTRARARRRGRERRRVRQRLERRGTQRVGDRRRCSAANARHAAQRRGARRGARCSKLESSPSSCSETQLARALAHGASVRSVLAYPV